MILIIGLNQPLIKSPCHRNYRTAWWIS